MGKNEEAGDSLRSRPVAAPGGGCSLFFTRSRNFRGAMINATTPVYCGVVDFPVPACAWFLRRQIILTSRTFDPPARFLPVHCNVDLQRVPVPRRIEAPPDRPVGHRGLISAGNPKICCRWRCAGFQKSLVRRCPRVSVVLTVAANQLTFAGSPRSFSGNSRKS